MRETVNLYLIKDVSLEIFFEVGDSKSMNVYMFELELVFLVAYRCLC